MPAGLGGFRAEPYCSVEAGSLADACVASSRSGRGPRSIDADTATSVRSETLYELAAGVLTRAIPSGTKEALARSLAYACEWCDRCAKQRCSRAADGVKLAEHGLHAPFTTDYRAACARRVDLDK